MKILLEKTPIDLEEYSDDLSPEWNNFFEEIHAYGKEKEFNKFAESCFQKETISFHEFNKWLQEEEDLIRDSLDMVDSNDMIDNEDEYEKEPGYIDEFSEDDY